jgi:hypothetical protein
MITKAGGAELEVWFVEAFFKLIKSMSLDVMCPCKDQLLCVDALTLDCIALCTPVPSLCHLVAAATISPPRPLSPPPPPPRVP